MDLDSCPGLAQVGKMTGASFMTNEPASNLEASSGSDQIQISRLLASWGEDYAPSGGWMQQDIGPEPQEEFIFETEMNGLLEPPGSFTWPSPQPQEDSLDASDGYTSFLLQDSPRSLDSPFFYPHPSAGADVTSDDAEILSDEMPWDYSCNDASVKNNTSCFVREDMMQDLHGSTELPCDEISFQFDNAEWNQNLELTDSPWQCDSEDLMSPVQSIPFSLNPRYALFPHQEQAVAWMREREMSSEKGGILADGMGSGKTVSTLALIFSDRSISQTKTNLIIVPQHLHIYQWRDAIEKFGPLDNSVSVFVYRNNKASIETMLRHDIVITTYGKASQDLTRFETSQDPNRDEHVPDSDFLLLHPKRPFFHRIIFDDAQYLLCKRPTIAASCQRLRATYRWCLTNVGLRDCYPLAERLGLEPSFRCSENLQMGLDSPIYAGPRTTDPVILRRPETVDGQPMMRMPSKWEEKIYVKLTSVEKMFYKQLEDASRTNLNQLIRTPSILGTYATDHALRMIEHLRQFCSHPYLVGNTYAESGRDIPDTVLIRCARCTSQRASHAAFCGHLLCRRCHNKTLGVPIQDQLIGCFACLFQARQDQSPRALFHGFLASDHPEPRSKEKRRTKIDFSTLQDLCTKSVTGNTALDKYVGYLRANWLPSAKVSQCVQLLKEIRQSGEKTIVVSQWPLLLDLVDVGLNLEGYDGITCRHVGRHALQTRNKAIKDFKESGHVLFLHLGPEIAGLDLTAASRIIIMEPSWDPYLERQAISRVHRFGQSKSVRIYRLVAADTLEERMEAQADLEHGEEGSQNGSLDEPIDIPRLTRLLDMIT